MSQLLGLLSPLGFHGGESRKVDSDLVDRISHSYTVLILIVFAIVVSTKQYVGDPIEVSARVGKYNSLRNIKSILLYQE